MRKTAITRGFALMLALVTVLCAAAAGFPAYANDEVPQEETVILTEEDSSAEPPSTPEEVPEESNEDPCTELPAETEADTGVHGEEVPPEEEPEQPIPQEEEPTEAVLPEEEPEPAAENEDDPDPQEDPQEDESLYDRFHIWSMDDEISMTGTVDLLDAEGNVLHTLTWEDNTMAVPHVAKLVFHAPEERPRAAMRVLGGPDYELITYNEYKDGDIIDICPMSDVLYEIWFGAVKDEPDSPEDRIEPEQNRALRNTQNLRAASSYVDSRWDNVVVGQKLTDTNWILTGITLVPGYGVNYEDPWNEGGAAAFYFSLENSTLRDRNVTLYITTSWSEYRYAWNRDYICSHSHGYCLWGGKAVPRTGWVGPCFITITRVESDWIYFDYMWLNSSGGAYWEDYQAVGGHGKYPRTPTGNPISLSKTSADSGMTSGNSCYSLAGAVYGIYSNAACTTELERITTDTNGNATSGDEYEAGTYYVKEITPSPGYLLDTQVHTLTLDSDGNCTVDTPFQEQPADDPGSVVIFKTSNGASFPITSSSAVFKVEYFPNDNWSGSPSRTWYYKTVNGLCQLGDWSFLDTSKTNYGAYTFPLGTVRISEVEAPAGYLKMSTMLEAKITQDTAGGRGTWHWTTAASGEIHYEADGTSLDNAPVPGQIDVLKRAANGAAMENCQLLLEYSTDDGATWAPVFSPTKAGDVYPGTCSSPGLADGVLSTGSDGYARFTGLIADDSTRYRVTELRTQNGKQLLAEPREIGTLPLPTDAVGPTHAVEITNTSVFRLPLTGGHGFWLIPVTMTACAIGIAAVLLWKRKRTNET